MNMKPLYVIADGPRDLNPLKVVGDAKRQIDAYDGHPGPVKYDITALLGKRILPLEGFLSDPRSAYGCLTGIVEKVTEYARLKGLETEVHIQQQYKGRQDSRFEESFFI